MGTSTRGTNKNTSYLKEIVEKYGWPTKSTVGQAAAHWAWYITQHSDHDVEFQEKCLHLMQELSQDEIDLYDLAYLADRVRANKNQPQLYGTQFRKDERGNRVLLPIENPEQLSQRRKAMGLDEPFEEHHKRMVKEE